MSKDLEAFYERKQRVKANGTPDMGEAEAAPPDRNAESDLPNYKGDAGPMNVPKGPK
jgi:hypothetical protein